MTKHCATERVKAKATGILSRLVKIKATGILSRLVKIKATGILSRLVIICCEYLFNNYLITFE